MDTQQQGRMMDESVQLELIALQENERARSRHDFRTLSCKKLGPVGMLRLEL